MLKGGRKSSPSIKSRMTFCRTSNIRLTLATFLTRSRGDFQGTFYDSLYPPKAEFCNNKSCLGFEDFISTTILERVNNGSLSVLGKVGEVDPPYLAMSQL